MNLKLYSVIFEALFSDFETFPVMIRLYSVILKLAVLSDFGTLFSELGALFSEFKAFFQ